jgi:hypothetical protein
MDGVGLDGKIESTVGLGDRIQVEKEQACVIMRICILRLDTGDFLKEPYGGQELVPGLQVKGLRMKGWD